MEQIEELIRDIPVKDLTSETARMYGEIRAALEKQGHPIGNNDLWIGTHATPTIWAGRPLPVRTKNPENPRAMIMIRLALSKKQIPRNGRIKVTTASEKSSASSGRFGVAGRRRRLSCVPTPASAARN